MTLVSELTEAFQRVGAEFKSVRTAVAGKSDTGHTHPVADLDATGRTASNYLRGDGTWATPTNTTYTALTLAEAQTGTATTSRAITALVLKQAIWHYVTGGTASGLTAFGQSIVTAADASAARTLLGATVTGSALLMAADAAAGRTALGSTTVGNSVFTAPDAGTARSALGATATGSSLFTAANAAAALSAIGAEAAANKGAANGYAPLDATSKVPAANLPAYVDDVLEYANLAGFPATGTSGLIYIALDTNKVYRWSGSAYVEISASLALGTTSSTAKPGDWKPAAADITDATATGRALLTSATPAAGRTTLGATAVGANVFTAVDAPAARTAISAEAAFAAGTASQFLDGTKTWRSVAIGDVSGLQVGLDAKATKASGTSGTGQPWSEQAIVNDGALASGYNKLPGGISVDFPAILTAFSFRLEDVSATIGGTGNLQIDWYAGSATAAETTLLGTTLIAAGQHNVLTVLGTEVAVDANTIIRAKFTMGSTTVSGPVYIGVRGRWQ